MANVEGPLVNAHVVVSTECESDDGLPHTLEHLVFLGSEKFPYKGVLDKVLESSPHARTALITEAFF